MASLVAIYSVFVSSAAGALDCVYWNDNILQSFNDLKVLWNNCHCINRIDHFSTFFPTEPTFPFVCTCGEGEKRPWLIPNMIFVKKIRNSKMSTEKERKKVVREQFYKRRVSLDSRWLQSNQNSPKQEALKDADKKITIQTNSIYSTCIVWNKKYLIFQKRLFPYCRLSNEHRMAVIELLVWERNNFEKDAKERVPNSNSKLVQFTWFEKDFILSP